MQMQMQTKYFLCIHNVHGQNILIIFWIFHYKIFQQNLSRLFFLPIICYADITNCNKMLVPGQRQSLDDFECQVSNEDQVSPSSDG